MQNQKLQINPDHHLWELYIAKKKNGQPKLDMPALDGDSLLFELGFDDIFSLDCKSSEKLVDRNSASWINYENDSGIFESNKEIY